MKAKDLLIIKTALEEVHHDSIDALRNVSVTPDRIAGVFRDGEELYDFTIFPDEVPERQVLVSPKGILGVKEDATPIALPVRWDEAEGEWVFEGQVRSDGGEWQIPCAALDEGMRDVIRGIIEAL